VTHGVLLVDKPMGRSSHAVVAVARRALESRRVGHAGTLDPMATGVLVLALGEGLKIVRYLALDEKRYEAVVRLGAETTTLDADGEVTRRMAVPAGLTLAQVREAARRFEGVTTQRAPVISALKRDGVPLYARVRRGELVEGPERRVQVHTLDVHAVRDGNIELSVHCGKGFYVRALARDLSVALGTVGHLAALRRVQSGCFTLQASVDFALLLAAEKGDDCARQELVRAVVPLEQALAGAPRLWLDNEGAEHIRQGRETSIEHAIGGDLPAADAEIEPVLLCSDAGTPLALARHAGGKLRVVRGLRY
jgi:tRNA pseudouridine55 synthase